MHLSIEQTQRAISLRIQQLRNLDTPSRYKRNIFRNTERNFRVMSLCSNARWSAVRDVYAPRAASVGDRRRIAHVLPHELFARVVR